MAEKSYKNAPLGGCGSESHERFIKDFKEWEAWSRDVLAPPFRDMIRWWKLYLAKRADLRDPTTEKWRANVFVPYPYSGVETVVATLVDIMMSSDPIVQFEAVPDTPGMADRARRVERRVDYIMRRNTWRQKIELYLREAGIQGTMAHKEIWKEDVIQMTAPGTRGEQQRMQDAIRAATEKGLPAPPADPSQGQEGLAAFMKWRTLVNSAKRPGVPFIPEPSVGGKRVVKYRGPWSVRVPIYNLRYDPQIQEFQEQPIVAHYMKKPVSWVERMVARGYFDEEQVKVAMEGRRAEEGNSSEPSDVDEYSRQIGEMLNINMGDRSNPSTRRSVDIFEVHRPWDEEAPYALIMNNKAVVNVNTQHQFKHKRHCVHLYRNVVVPGQAHGISELQQPESLYYEMNVLRSLRLDGVTLKTLPIFVKGRETGMSEMRRHVRPGAVWETMSPDRIKTLMNDSNLADSFREIFEIKGDIDETNSSFAQLRGAPSTVGRVSATESERRMQSALTRVKLKAGGVEDQFTETLEQWLALCWEFGTQDEKREVEDAAVNEKRMAELETTGLPDDGVERADMLEALTWGIRMRGATRALNRELQLQQLMQWAKDFGAVLVPEEQRALAKLTLEIGNIKGTDKILQDRWTQFAQKAWEMQQQAAMMQQQGQQQPGQPPMGSASSGVAAASGGAPPSAADPSTGGASANPMVADGGHQQGEPMDVSLEEAQALAGSQPQPPAGPEPAIPLA